MRSKLRAVATAFAAAVFAVGLSVGAAVAEDMTTDDRPRAAHWAPTGVCLLDGRTLRGDRP